MSLESVWQARHGRAPLPDPHDVALPAEAEMVVVGGGLTGLTTALLLGRAGRDVVLLEAHEVGAGTTGRSTAKLSLLQGTQLSTIASKHAVSVVGQYVEANTEAQAWVQRFCEDHEVELQHRSAYTYANGPGGERRVRREHDVARQAGLPVEWVDELPLPYPTRGGVRLEAQVQLDPLELLAALRSQAEAHGVRIVEGVRLLKASGRSPVRLHTTAGVLSASRVVLCTNMPVLDRGAFFARMSPSRSYGLSFLAPSAAIDGMYLSADSPSRSLRDTPSPEGTLLLVGGNGHATGRGGSTALRLEELRSWTHDHWPDAVETTAWSAQDYTPHHGLPYAGPILPGSSEILVAGGFSKWGMTNGVAAALAVTAEILGGHVRWAEALRTWSTHDLRGLSTAAKINAEVGVEMVRGWLRPLRHPGASPTPSEGDGQVTWQRPGRAPTAATREGGAEHRVSAICTHLGGVVGWNDAERSWDCPLHGSRFAPDGQVLEGPATCGLRRH